MCATTRVLLQALRPRHASGYWVELPLILSQMMMAGWAMRRVFRWRLPDVLQTQAVVGILHAVHSIVVRLMARPLQWYLVAVWVVAVCGGLLVAVDS